MTDDQILFWSKGPEEFRFLSNFYPCRLQDPFGKVYHSVEHMYQCWKTTCPEDWESVYSCRTAAEARRAGSKVKLADSWNSTKDGVMEMCVRLKFSQNPELAKMLLMTEYLDLVEYAPWGDTYWGVDKELKGQNRLGKILEKVREELRVVGIG